MLEIPCIVLSGFMILCLKEDSCNVSISYHLNKQFHLSKYYLLNSE